MKLTLSLLAISICGLATGMAGGFGGPGPFRNNSPLPTGTDGLYNASMRGDNLAGIFRFSITNGSQGGDVTTPNPTVLGGVYSTRTNSWVAWYEGIVYRGLTDAAIIDGNVAGVLDVMAAPAAQQNQPTSPVTGTITETTGESFEEDNTSPTTTTAITITNPNGTVTTIGPGTGTITTAVERSNSQTINTPIVFPPGINTTLMGGEFSGSIDLNSPTGSMKGSGKFVVIENRGTVNSELEPRGPNDPQFVADEVNFKWRGARVFSGTVATATGGTTP
jgi:hypothetical protein